MNLSITQRYLQSVLQYNPLTGVFINLVDRNGRAVKGAVAGYTNTIGYTVIQMQGRKLHAHRLAWFYMTGEWPVNQIDHINRVRSDNWIENLRQATSHQNAQNTKDHSGNTSGHRGVTWHKKNKNWQAQMLVLGKYVYLGAFDRIEDAVEARKKAVASLHTFAQNV
jgi:hypothetical protein